MPECWVLGDTAVDLIPDGTEYVRFPGGTGANVAVALSRLGIRNAFITKIGNDPAGAFITDKLQRENVDTQYVSRSEDYKTSLIEVSIDAQGERAFNFTVKPSADSQMEISDIPAFERGDWLCVSCFVLAQPPSREATFHAMRQAQKSGAVVCVDANMRIDMWDDKSLLVPETVEALKNADIAKMSEDELLLLSNADSTDEAIEEIKQWPAKIKVITLADKGAILVTEKANYRIEGYSVPVVDMTGAGDAFFAALVSQLMPSESWSDEQLIEAVRFSNACGALVVGKMGAMSALPDLETVKKFMLEEGQNVET